MLRGHGGLEALDHQAVVGGRVLQPLPHLASHIEQEPLWRRPALDDLQRLGLEVEFRSEAVSEFTGTLSVATNDPVNPVLEVPLRARGASCAEGCPLAHATPSCAGGECSIESCQSSWFETDGVAANGCECSETANDPGGSCQDAVYLGELIDNEDDTASFQGVLPTADDVDVLRFFAKDAWSISDEFHVRVQLTSSDPNIRLCVYRHEADSHQGDCYWTEEKCPANRVYDLPSAGNGGDDADFIVKVHRPSGAPTCAGYSLTVSNGL